MASPVPLDMLNKIKTETAFPAALDQAYASGNK